MHNQAVITVILWTKFTFHIYWFASSMVVFVVSFVVHDVISSVFEQSSGQEHGGDTLSLWKQ